MVRYTDFIVNEITEDGEVVHLKSTDVPVDPTAVVQPESEMYVCATPSTHELISVRCA